MKLLRGFTVIEILFVVTLLFFASILFFTQKEAIITAAYDEQSKTAINSIHYNLQAVYYPKNQSYPRVIDEKTLPDINPELFKDPDGNTIGSPESRYRYEPTECTSDTSCKGYTLRAILEKEADFIKTNTSPR